MTALEAAPIVVIGSGLVRCSPAREFDRQTPLSMLSRAHRAGFWSMSVPSNALAGRPQQRS